MKNQKCPGIDGFSAELFKVFRAILIFFVLRSLIMFDISVGKVEGRINTNFLTRYLEFIKTLH